MARLADKLYVVGLYLVLQSLDAFTTYVGLRRGAEEANLLPRWLLEHYGELGMFAFKVALVLGILLLVVKLQRRFPVVWLAVRVINVLMLVVIAINLVVLA